MFSLRSALLLLCLAGATAWAQDRFPGIGRTAKPAEVAAWDIDVRPDFRGLPKGSGSVARGQVLWEAQCASCHGVFGESNQVFMPLVGGTTAEDVKTGRVARLTDPTFPGRTTLMKVSTVSTLWDYIHRAMPWNNPKTLSADEVYALTAFLLNLGGVVADDFVLSDANIAQVQQRLPNRLGMRSDHALWPGRNPGPDTAAPPDVRASACMRDCGPEARVVSHLPDFARNQHGNLAEQNRLVGAQHGADTTRPPGAAPVPAAVAAAPRSTLASLLQKHNCTTCHGITNKVVGPALREVATRYAGRGDAEAFLAGRIKAGSQGIWGAIPMPSQNLPDNELKAIAQWLAAGASNP
jgi:cytochrome c